MIRVHINQGYFNDVIKVFIVRHYDHGRGLLHYGHEDRRLTWDELTPEGEALTDEPAPTIELPGEAGRALLDELTRYYQGTEDTRTLRRDYDAERKRVDTQAQVIADIAQTLAANARQGGTHGR